MPEQNASAEPLVYQLRIVLRSISPLIWRRLLVLYGTCEFVLAITITIALAPAIAWSGIGQAPPSGAGDPSQAAGVRYQGRLYAFQVEATTWLTDMDVVGDIGRLDAFLSLGLIDHVAIDIVPVVFGRGKPCFGTLANGHLMFEDPEVVIQGDGALHLRYPVRR